MPRVLQRLVTWTLWQLSLHRGVPWRVRSGPTLRIHPEGRWIRNDDYERPLVDYLAARVRPGDCCIDVGAHVGFYVLQMAMWTAPGGRIVAFEPNPTARRALHTNVVLNGLEERVRIEAVAVSRAAGRARLSLSAEASGISRLTSREHDGGVPVETITLDAYCRARGLAPAWVLVDVEGAEGDVLAGAAELLADPRVSIVVEMHPELWPSPATGADVARLAAQHGRTIVSLTGQRDPLAEYGTVVLSPPMPPAQP